MQIRMTLHVPRRRPRPVELVVRWRRPEPVAALRTALSEHLGEPVEALAVEGCRLDDEQLVGEPPLLDGVSVAVVTGGGGQGPGGAGARPATVLEVVSVGGPDAGRGLPLVPPGLAVGRSPAAGLRLDDPSLSRAHCRLEVTPDGVRVVDLGSTNGVEVDGLRVEGSAPVDTASRLVIGASTLRLRRTGPPGTSVRHPGDGTAVVAPVVTAAAVPPGIDLVAPRAPTPPARGRVPWVAALAPVPVVGVLAYFLGPQVLAFALLGPVVLLATGLGDRVGSRRRHRRAVAEHSAALADHELLVATALAAEAHLRHLSHPDPHEVLRRAVDRGSGLWARPGDRTVRLGLGEVGSAARVVDDRGLAGPRTLVAAPVVLDLADSPGVGVVGPADEAGRVLAALVGQLVVRSPPSDLAIERLGGGARWSWLDLLPHRSSPGPVLLVVPDPGATGVATRVAAVHAGGGIVLATAARAELLPDACTVRVEVTGGGRAEVEGAGPVSGLVADGVGPAWCERLARALSPLREEGVRASALPRDSALPDVLGDDVLTADGVVRRWSTARGPTAVVGTTSEGPFRLDLAVDGPHVLVGGTTGSGKSEFLRTLVTGLALDSPPGDVALLLVDFKGGAAFGPCADLPHVVGLVTDLDEHLVRRVLTSLEAELRRREQVLAAGGCSDLADHRRRADPEERMPRLVVVVDELRALVDDHPEALSALVRLAAQGRSLGMHLVLATQRPAGTVTAEVQANVNLRVAFRVRDRADSVHVVEDDSAAALPSDVPGRGIARGGDGASTTFQAALVTPARPAGPSLEVLGVGSEHPTADEPADRADQLAAVVEVVRRAHAVTGGTLPGRPWLPPLPSALPATGRPAGTVALVDEPDRQRQVPWTWDASVPLWRVVGRPRSGRSTALRALVGAAAAVLPPDRLHVHVLAPDLDPWPRALPHVGTAARLDDGAAVDALLDHLSTPADPEAPLRLLVVDGWDLLSDADDPRAGAPASERLLRLVRDAGRTRVVCAVSGGRDLLRPRWSGLGGEVLLLGPSDPLDLALLGGESTGRGLTGTAVPGRGLRARDGREVQIVDPSASPAAAHAPRRPSPRAPWTFTPLPDRVTRQEVDGPEDGWVVGVTGPTATPWSWQPHTHGRRLLVAGPPRSGRTTTLHALAASALADGRRVVMVQPTATGRGPRRAADGGLETIGPDDVDRLVGLRTAHPDLVVLVDDADRLDDAALRPVLAEVADLVDRDAGAVVVATSSLALATRFRGLDVSVARHRTGILLRPGPDDAPLLGLSRAGIPSSTDGWPTGRGLLVLGGRATPLQVLAEEPADPRDHPDGPVTAGRRTPRPEPAR